jgi:hypothetical protein
MAEQPLPGSFKLEYVKLGTDGNATDITGLVSEVNVYSSIMDSTNVMRFVVIDAVNLLGKLPVQGGIPIDTQITINSGTKRNYKLVITKVAAIQSLTTQRAYIIEAISELAFISQFSKISKAYKGTYNEIALRIFQETTTEKYGIFDGSLGNKEVIIPNWSPLKALKWLASKARDESKNVRFRFFQDSKGLYNFMPIETAVDLYKDKPAQTFALNTSIQRKQNSANDLPDTARDMQTILAIDYKETFDITRALRDGFLFGRNYNIDIENKNTEIVDYDYYKEHNKDSYLNESFFYPANEYKPGIIRVNTDNADIDVSQIKRSSVNGYNQAISINVHGNQEIDIGQVVEIKIPEPTADNTKGNLDKVWSGKYFVVGKRDTFKDKQFMTSLDLVKDGL